MLFRKRNQDTEPLIFRVFGATLGAVVMFFVEVVQIVIIAAAIIIPVRYFLIQPFIVKGASMEPSYLDSEYLIVDEVTYRFRDIERGEVVVFRPPNGSTQFYIKRVVGLPGETVEVKEGKISIYNSEYPNGIELEEIYIDEVTEGREKVTLGLDEYY
ncbi:MAG: signal peptidase I, partial [Patescibacteria group bacterium]